MKLEEVFKNQNFRDKVYTSNEHQKVQDEVKNAFERSSKRSSEIYSNHNNRYLLELLMKRDLHKESLTDEENLYIEKETKIKNDFEEQDSGKKIDEDGIKKELEESLILEQITKKIITNQPLSEQDDLIISQNIIKLKREIVSIMEKSKIQKIIQRLKERHVDNKKIDESIVLLESILSRGGEVDESGNVTLYHGTTKDRADKIEIENNFINRKDNYGIYFSTSKDMYLEWAKDSPDEKVLLKFKIPIEDLEEDPLMKDDIDCVNVRIPVKKADKKIDISNYIIIN